MINSLDSHFKYFEDSTLVKVRKEFKEQRLDSLNKLITRDRKFLGPWIQHTQSAITKGGNVYKSCLILEKFTATNEKKIKEIEQQLAIISNNLDPLVSSVCLQDCQVISLLDQIKNLKFENERIIIRVSDLRGLISTKIEMMANALKEEKSVVTTPNLVSLEAT